MALGFSQASRKRVVEHAEREADADELLDARVARADGEADARAEREAGHPQRHAGVALGQELEGRESVVLLAGVAVVTAGRRADATEVEAQHGDAGVVEGLGGAVDDVVVHRAAAERVRVADDGGGDGRGGLLEDRLELSVRRRGSRGGRRARASGGEVDMTAQFATQWATTPSGLQVPEGAQSACDVQERGAQKVAVGAGGEVVKPSAPPPVPVSQESSGSRVHVRRSSSRSRGRARGRRRRSRTRCPAGRRRQRRSSRCTGRPRPDRRRGPSRRRRSSSWPWASRHESPTPPEDRAARRRSPRRAAPRPGSARHTRPSPQSASLGAGPRGRAASASRARRPRSPERVRRAARVGARARVAAGGVARGAVARARVGAGHRAVGGGVDDLGDVARAAVARGRRLGRRSASRASARRARRPRPVDAPRVARRSAWRDVDARARRRRRRSRPPAQALVQTPCGKAAPHGAPSPHRQKRPAAHCVSTSHGAPAASAVT